MTIGLRRFWILFLPVLLLVESRFAVAQIFTEYSVSIGRPLALAAGSDGSLWFSVEERDRIGRISHGGVITSYPLRSPALVTSMAFDADGSLWFTEFDTGRIGRLAPGGETTEFEIPTRDSRPTFITLGPDGNLWFTEGAFPKIGRVTPTGEFREFSVGDFCKSLGSIVAALDGTLWFSEPNSPQYWSCYPSRHPPRFGKLTIDGTILEYERAGTGPCFRLTAGGDGGIWYTGPDVIGRISPVGNVREFRIPTPGGLPWDLTWGPDGNVWFTENEANKIGRLTPSGEFNEWSLPSPSSSPANITTGPEGSIWFVELHTGRIGHIRVSSSTRDRPPRRIPFR